MPDSSSAANINVDINQIATDLNGKADKDLMNLEINSNFSTSLNNAGIRTVVETYTNGTQWYRLWSDGWLEQGDTYAYISNAGDMTFTLLKPFASPSYTAVCDRCTRNYSSGQTNPTVGRPSATQITISSGGGAADYVQYYACGWAA